MSLKRSEKIGSVAQGEEAVTALLRALRAAEQKLAVRDTELSREDGWSEVTHQVGVSELRIGEETYLSVDGYLDGERAGLGGVGWVFDLIRNGDGWRVERSLVVNANDKNYQGTASELPAVACAQTEELARDLPGLLDELLALPAPGIV